MNRKKLELNQETLKNLTSSQARNEKEQLAYTFPPVCENTNYISCIRC